MLFTLTGVLAAAPLAASLPVARVPLAAAPPRITARLNKFRLCSENNYCVVKYGFSSSANTYSDRNLKNKKERYIPPRPAVAAPLPLIDAPPLPPAAAPFAAGAADLASDAFFTSSSALILSCHHF